ncbi:hypothetical protein [Desulforhopalus singaporensis]|uniref:YtkA-like n=1 Tax=Desulforhopalus singaporensis TaxID=91360 RepID=A0A1H0NA33_9BACT|nr:hypothetical protein [Desulforhopalus singaporensis]SDO89275.1 hypothetical protein SAMN05660330_01306 [Desulforhopalus singaporensis]
MKRISLLLTLLTIFVYTNSFAMSDSGHGHTMDHKGNSFVHKTMVDDLHAQFQVMDLASMNMKDPEGRTHHVMMSFMRNGEKILKAVGKVKLVSPSGKEQLANLKDYGSGIFAANFTIDEPGKWGIICLFKEAGGEHTVKFWYSHMPM